MGSFPSYQSLSNAFSKAGYQIPLKVKFKEVGKGEQGRIIKVTRKSINKLFAAKIVIPQKDKFSQEEKKQFLSEVTCMVSIEPTDYVVPIIDQFEVGKNTLCYVMDFVEAPNLKERLKEERFIKSNKVLEHMLDIFWQIAHGIFYIHKAGVVHRDIKESNILIKDNKLGGYLAIITDFGFGYSLKKQKHSPKGRAQKLSSYFEEAKAEGFTSFRIDYYCFAKMVDSIINQCDFLKNSKFDPILRSITRDIIRKGINTKNDLSLDKEIIERFADLRRRSVIYRVDPLFSSLLAVPELTDVGDGDVIRISGEITVPMTKRLLRIIDSPPFQKLRNINHLSNVHLVYPGAFYSRFEHSIGVYNLSRRVLRKLLQAEAFTSPIDKSHVESLLLAAILHDIGHIPHAHDLEEIGYYNHEKAAEEIIKSDPISTIICSDWKTNPEEVSNLIRKKLIGDKTRQVLRDILASTYDIDVMDYLIRDSIHLGVPYGKSFDLDRLIFSLTLNERGNSIAITHKGIVPAEFFLIARHAMYSQVYLHHTVRASVAMLQRALWEKTRNFTDSRRKSFLNKISLIHIGEISFYKKCAGSEGSTEHKILGPLSKNERKLYKRFFEIPDDLYDEVKALNFSKRVEVVKALVNKMNKKGQIKLEPWQVLLDVPPIKFQKTSLKVFIEKEQKYEKIESMSPLIEALQAEFDKSSRKARLFMENKEFVQRVLTIIGEEGVLNMLKDSIEESKKK